MTNKLFETTLISDEKETSEAYINLSGRLNNGTLDRFSDLDNFVYNLNHTSAARSDLYLVSRAHVWLSSCRNSSFCGKYKFDNLILAIKAATDRFGKNPLILTYDCLPTNFLEEDKSIYIPDGAITPIPNKDQGNIYSASFYSSLASLLNDENFRKGIKTREPVTLGNVEANHYSILTFNPEESRKKVPAIFINSSNF